MDAKEYLEYWAALKDEIRRFDEIDDLGVIFGSRTEGFGHQYKVLPAVPEKDLAAFERRTGLGLPPVYRTYLQAFGAGGAGPDYGVYDFADTVQHRDFPEPFPLVDAEAGMDLDDDDPAFDLPGLAYICSHGCAIESSIEINGPEPGRIWCDSSDVIWNSGNFHDFYRSWADKTRLRLERFDLLKTVVDRKPWDAVPRKLPFEEIVGIMNCEYCEFDRSDDELIPGAAFEIGFAETPGRVYLDEKRELVKIVPRRLL